MILSLAFWQKLTFIRTEFETIMFLHHIKKKATTTKILTLNILAVKRNELLAVLFLMNKKWKMWIKILSSSFPHRLDVMTLKIFFLSWHHTLDCFIFFFVTTNIHHKRTLLIFVNVGFVRKRILYNRSVFNSYHILASCNY